MKATKSNPPRRSRKAAEPRRWLIFHAGPYAYRLVIGDRRLFGRSGKEQEAIIAENERLIVISPTVAPDRREDVALHELYHAATFAFGIPDGEEGRCDMTASVARQFRMDLAEQGGIEALMRLPAIRVAGVGMPGHASAAWQAGDPPAWLAYSAGAAGLASMAGRAGR